MINVNARIVIGYKNIVNVYTKMVNNGGCE